MVLSKTLFRFQSQITHLAIKIVVDGVEFLVVDNFASIFSAIAVLISVGGILHLLLRIDPAWLGSKT
jgi:hypothetical protein